MAATWRTRDGNIGRTSSMLGKHRRAQTIVASFGVRAGLVFFGLLALGYAEIRPVAQSLRELPTIQMFINEYPGISQAAPSL